MSTLLEGSRRSSFSSSNAESPNIQPGEDSLPPNVQTESPCVIGVENCPEALGRHLPPSVERNANWQFTLSCSSGASGASGASSLSHASSAVRSEHSWHSKSYYSSGQPRESKFSSASDTTGLSKGGAPGPRESRKSEARSEVWSPTGSGASIPEDGEAKAFEATPASKWHIWPRRISLEPPLARDKSNHTVQSLMDSISHMTSLGRSSRSSTRGSVNSGIPGIGSNRSSRTSRFSTRGSILGLATSGTLTSMSSRRRRSTTFSAGRKLRESLPFACTETLQLTVAPTLLRGVNLATVLSGCGHFMRAGVQSYGSEELYDLSTQMENLTFFYSHCWLDSRVSKFLTLCFTHNGVVAWRASLIYSFIMLMLQRHELVPLLMPPTVWHIAGEKISLTIGCWCFLGGPIIFLIFVWKWQLLAECFRPPVYTFLDKLCIHQTDERLKTEGILGIGGILKSSEQMVVLWSPRYFQRLWCMFEVAVWCSLSRVDDLIIVPMAKTVMVPIGMAFLYVNLFFVVLEQLNFRNVVLVLSGFYVSFMCIVTHHIRGTMREMLGFEEQLQNFTMAGANCFCCTHDHIHPQTKEGMPCDRVLVMNTINELFPGQESVAQLERRFRTEWGKRVAETLGGPDSMPLRGCLVMICPMIWMTCDILSAPELEVQSMVFVRLLLTRTIYLADSIACIRIFLYVCYSLSRKRDSGALDCFITVCAVCTCIFCVGALFAKTYELSKAVAHWPQVCNGLILTGMVCAIGWYEFAPAVEDLIDLIRSRSPPSSPRINAHVSPGKVVPESGSPVSAAGGDGFDSIF